MDTSIFSDPVKIGPGIWFTMHTNAVNAITDPIKLSFETNINAICDNFKCKKCQLHFRKFIDTHPFHKYWNIHDELGRDIGFFKWTWELHNEVNKFLGKYQPSLQEAYDFFSNNEAGACFNCDSPMVSNKLPEETIEQRSRAIPPILTLYRTSDNIKPQPFRLVSRTE
jgi:hypothetical protein